MDIALVAEEAAGVRTLQRLARSHHRVRRVLTASPEGAGVAASAAELGVPITPADRVRDPGLADELRGAGIDVLLNVHSLHLVRPEVLAAPRVGAFNLHPGPLPECAGLNAPSWAVARGHAEHGVTLHRMEAGIDTGDVVEQIRFPITADDTALTVSVRCVARGQELVDRLLAHLDAGVVPRHPQDLSARRYFGRGVPYEGRVPWAKPAREVLAFVRACDYGPYPSPWGIPAARRGDSEIAVVRLAGTGRPCPGRAPGEVAVDDEGPVVATADEWVRPRRLVASGRGCEPGAVLRAGDRLS
ncbi:UDP-4-amino-4-deoxy-L-arabinose formyltransferase/UDP-glucuronic acid dehydrogenase (UDP-4-keto-hexauronic acid decarboxylating) [Actinomycetospora succinea]|uniref:UDP-4-amino-4-deoxy-L-arabinose formyltransferase/UDP-glucuronic acid dehydrogenase (UDP-4-keto-hexauronic acid decarboxylating) n=1 Tax=Actinomycetospora succinea TaxID=663603 RepID=A0A4R6V281_9PSEU|nr:formyltransferase family protein [Actinomycetospora succinea]TDQ50194.1 UDP-4-amino-4-deoxy-L-arabinose formyltransferase/UDP-glucuronic acid dehydrogenase (UDP-4-keto-hexauronic acid decarboxylating) [Actinomycetospora succinea]